jgi:hypothetical protein
LSHLSPHSSQKPNPKHSLQIPIFSEEEDAN